jgi:outer membrane protein assembly factor BamA
VGRGHTTILGTRFDLTDDYYDPRRGFRLDVSRWHSPPDDLGSDYYVMEYNTSAYVPIGRRSTLALNYFRSDAHVDRQGEIIESEIEKDIGVDCSLYPIDSPERTACDQVVENIRLNNTYGTASSLGGFNRLRSYPGGRYSGAHTVFYGTELRWNLTDEATPFNIFIMKDIRTAFQIALFYETGSVADIRSEVGDIMRSSYGLGVRMVTASGAVFRVDVAAGYEGIQPSMFIGYPWEL